MASSNPSQPSTTPIILARTVRRITRRLPILSISFPGFIYFPPALSRRVKTALGRLEYSFSISLTIRRLVRFYGLDRRKGSREWEEFKFPWAETIEHGLLTLMAIPLFYVQATSIFIKLFFIFGYILLCLVPITSQFFFPATPVLAWVLLFFSNRFIPKDLRPHIWVSVLPTLETVLYGTNISDILTRYKSQIAFLDILAWLPYGVLHFALPGIVAILLFIFVEKEGAIKLFARAFGYMNLTGVFIQIVFPCAPPWYELIHGLTPADYGMIGSPAGLARIDTLFGSHSYTTTFRASPLVFGAFPSLHAGCSTMEGLFMTHFFPWGKVYWWSYVATVYWSTMHLSHHYMIDLTAGGSLAIVFFYYFLSRSSFIDYTPPSPTQQNASKFVTGVRNINGDPTPEASSGSDSPTDESLSETGMERDLEGAYGTKFERIISHFGLSGRKDDKNGRFFDDGVPNSAVPFLADQERPLTPTNPNRAKIVIEDSDPPSHLDKP